MSEVTPNDTELKPEVKQEEQVPVSQQNEANWRKFREEREKERKARMEAEALAQRKAEEVEAMKQAMDALLNKTPQQSNDYYEETEQERVQKWVQETLQRERQKQQEEERRQQQAQMPQMLRANHPDFNEVVTPENLDYLEYKYPKLAKAFSALPDSYDKWESVYDAIKNFIPYKNKESDEKRIQNNMMKPQSSPGIADHKPQTAGWRLTEEQRKANWKRMQQDMKSFG